MYLRMRNGLLILADAVMINLAIYVTLLFRFEANIPVYFRHNFIKLIPLFTIVNIFFLLALKLYNRIWEYASIGEMLAILRATTCSLVATLLIIYTFHLPILPRSVYIGSYIMVTVVVCASRISWRVFRDLFINHGQPADRNVLIVGAGDAGAMLVREIHQNPRLNIRVAGFIDDDQHKKGQILAGVPILGSRSKIPLLVRELEINEIIIAMPSVSGAKLRPIVDLCKQTTARVRILPGIYTNKGSMLTQLRSVQMEDLLGREPVKIDLQQVSGYIENKTVMVTGAGGSIGSELCRQLLKFKPGRLILVECCENNLFDIENELKGLQAETPILGVLLDVRNQDKLDKLFKMYRPQVIFHAAAYKHVPMMERYPEEAIDNNVIGTRNVAVMADRYRCETFILISTDKAVNPSSVMGATKRIAELIIKDLNHSSSTRFAAVRFGNVLGSRGSVIPTFINQIKQGGPVTVTHPDMKRFFMTIPEAVELVIEAGSMAKGGEVFILDMGEQVKIVDLARDLIKLLGYEPDRDIEITYTGIRPGEKLQEELFTDREGMAATRHERIFISKKELDDAYNGINKSIKLLVKNTGRERSEILRLISSLVPEYKRPEYTEDDAVIYLNKNLKEPKTVAN